MQCRPDRAADPANGRAAQPRGVDAGRLGPTLLGRRSDCSPTPTRDVRQHRPWALGRWSIAAGISGFSKKRSLKPAGLFFTVVHEMRVRQDVLRLIVYLVPGSWKSNLPPIASSRTEAGPFLSAAIISCARSSLSSRVCRFGLWRSQGSARDAGRD